MWCSSEEWQTTKTALSGTWGVSSAGVCWTLLWFGALGVELVSNSVAGFSGGVSCPSEVSVITVLWEWGEGVLFSVAGWVSWSLPSRPAASQAESGFSFFSHFRSSSFHWKNFHHHFHQLLWVETRWCLLFLHGFSLSSVSLESLWILSSIPWAGCSRVSLSFSLGGSVGFPWVFPSWVSKWAWLVPRSLPMTFVRPWLVPWLLPVPSRWVLTSTRSIPAFVPLFRSGTSMGVSFFVERGCIPLSGWRLGIVLALGAL